MDVPTHGIEALTARGATRRSDAVALGAAGSYPTRAAIDAVRTPRARVGVEKSIRELGGAPESVPQLVADALADMILITNPKPLSVACVTRLYEAAMAR